MDKYLGMISSLEDNFMEFKRLKEELNKVFRWYTTLLEYGILLFTLVQIQQEIHALEALDEVSNEELLELSDMGPTTKSVSLMQKRLSRPQTGGTAVCLEGSLHA